MFFTPHILYVKDIPSVEYDEYGQAVEPERVGWREVCRCRCDDTSTAEVTDPSGRVIRPSYHVVMPSSANGKVRVGDEVRIVCHGTLTERGCGVVKNVKGLNYLDYSEIWI